MVELTAFPKCAILELMGKKSGKFCCPMGKSDGFVEAVCDVCVGWLREHGVNTCVFNDLVKMQTNEELHLRAI